jgi:hypothetical protein
VQSLKNKDFYLKCSCGAEGIYALKDEEFIFLSYFCFNPKRMNIIDKARYIWKVIKGKPFEDQLVLSNKDVSRLIKELSKLSK